MHNKNELKIMDRSMDVVENIYSLTKTFPKEEIFGLTSQMRRAAISISSNIAEGAGRNSDAEFINFLSISNVSANELEVQVQLGMRLNFSDQKEGDLLLKDLTVLQKMNYNSN